MISAAEQHDVGCLQTITALLHFHYITSKSYTEPLQTYQYTRRYIHVESNKTRYKTF